MTITHRITTPSTSNTNSYPSGSFTPAVGDLLVVLVTASATVDPGAVTNSAGLSFVRVESALKANSADSLYAFVSTGLVTSAVAQTCTFSCPNDAATGAIVSVLSISGMTLTGYDAIIRAGVQNNGAAAGTPTCALGHAALTQNPLIGFVGNASSPANMTPPSGWAENTDTTGYSTPTTGQEVASIVSDFTGSTVTWGGTSATAFGAIVLEFDTSTTAPVSSRPVVGTGLRTDYKWGVDWSTVLAFPFNEGSGSTVSGLTMSGTIDSNSWPSGGGFFWNGTDNQIPTSLLEGASEYTIFTKFTPASDGAEQTFYYGTDPTGEYYEIVYEILPPYLTFSTRDTSTGLTGARNNDIYTTYTGATGVTFTAFASYSVSAGYKMQGVNGAISTGYAANSVDAMTTGWANENIGANVFYGTYLYGKMDIYILIKNKALTLYQIAALTANPWLIYAPGAGSVSGSGSLVGSTDTTSSSGTVSTTGSGASTETADVDSGSDTTRQGILGSGTPTGNTDTDSGSGTISVSGSGASVDGKDTASSTSTVSISGSGASVDRTDTASSTSAVFISGSGASTESTDANSGSGLGNTASRPTGSGILSNWDSIVANVRVGVSDDYSKSLNVQDIVNIISILQGEANTASPLRGILNSHINDKNNPHNVTVAVSDLDLLNVLYTAYGQRFGTTLSFSDFSLAFINLNHFATTTDVDNGTNQNAVVNLSVMEYIVNNHNTSLTAHENMFRNYLPGYPLPFSPSLVVDPLVAIVFPVTVNRNCTMNYHDVNGHVLTAGANTLSADYLYGFPALPIFGPHTNTLLNSKSMSDVVLHNATNNQSSGLLIVTPTIDTTCLILEEDNSNGTHGFVDSITVIPGSNNYSYYYYPISRSQLTISALDSNSNVIGIALYDCTAVTAITNGAMAESVVDIFELPNGWYRCTFAFDASVNPITGFSVDVIDSIDPNNNFNNVYTGTGQNAGAFWQHQLTSTVLPTPPVFTTTTSVSVLGTIYQQAFSGFNQLYGSILVNYISPIPEIFGTSRSVMRIGNNSDNTSAVRFDNDPGNPAQNRIRSYDGNNVVISTFESDPYSGDLAPIKRISYTYSNTVQGYGFTDQVPVVEEVPATLNSATILELGYDSLSDTYLDGYLLSFRYYPIQSTVMNLEFLMAQYVRTNSFIDPSGNVLADPGGDTLIYPGGD